MKRKLFLAVLIVAVLSCLFVIGVSAEAYDDSRTTIEYTDINGVKHTVPVVKFDVEPSTVNDAIKLDTSRTHKCNLSGLTAMADDSALCILKDTQDNLTAYPSWYLIDADGTQIYEISYGYLDSVSQTTGKTYNEGSILYMEFPEGMTHLRNNGVWGRGTHYEKNITEIVIPKSVTVAVGHAFENNTTLKKVYIREGSNMTEIQDYAFEGCTALEYFQFESLTKLTLIDGFAADAKLAGDLDLSQNKELKTIGNNAFKDTLLGKITLPDSVESIGSKAFCGANFYFASPYLPKNLTSLGNEFLSGTRNLNSLLIFPVGITSINDEGFSGCYPADSSQTFTIVFLGKMTKVFIDGHSYTNWGAQTNIYFAQNSLSDVMANVYSYTDKQTGALGSVIINNTSTGTLDLDIATNSPQSTSQVGDNFIRLYFCSGNGAVETSHILTNDGKGITEDRGTFVMENHTHYGAQEMTAPTCGEDGFNGVNCIVCDKQVGETVPATGLHTSEDDGNCETEVVCTVCEAVVKEAIAHILGKVYSYENGYLSVGSLKVGCTNEGCEHGEKSEIPALAVSKGYSQETGTDKGAIVFGITFNRDAIKAYEGYLGTTIDFGLIASGVQDNSPLNEDASAKVGTVKSSFAGASYSIFQIKLTDIESAQMDKLFHCGGYLVVNGEISYVNNKEISSTSTLVSYNIVTTLVSSKED